MIVTDDVYSVIIFLPVHIAPITLICRVNFSNFDGVDFIGYTIDASVSIICKGYYARSTGSVFSACRAEFKTAIDIVVMRKSECDLIYNCHIKYIIHPVPGK